MVNISHNLPHFMHRPPATRVHPDALPRVVIWNYTCYRCVLPPFGVHLDQPPHSSAAMTTCMLCAVAEDEAVVALLADQFEQVVQFSATVIGALPEPGLSAARPDIRNKEMAIGNAVCDAMLASLRDTVCSQPMPHQVFRVAEHLHLSNAPLLTHLRAALFSLWICRSVLMDLSVTMG